MVVSSPISQLITGSQGVYSAANIEHRDMTLREFKAMAEDKENCLPLPDDAEPEAIARFYWKNVTYRQAVYGADVQGSLYDPDVKEWNINRLGTILDVIEEETGVKMKGVNTSYLYFGMWKATFAIHTEDVSCGCRGLAIE